MQKIRVEDDQFLWQLNMGEEPAFEILFTTFYQPLCYFANKIIRNEEVVRDIVQELFITIWGKKFQFENLIALKAFLYKSGYNRALNYIEKENNRRRIENKIITPNHEEEFELCELETDIFEQIFLAVEELPKDCARIFRMSYLENMDVKTISERLNIAASTIMTQRARAKKTLKAKFKNEKIYFLFFC